MFHTTLGDDRHRAAVPARIAILRPDGLHAASRHRPHHFIWLGATVPRPWAQSQQWLLGAGGLHTASLKYPIKDQAACFRRQFPVSTWSIRHSPRAVATVTDIIAVMTAAVIPARRAAQLEPGDIIRGTSQ